MKIFFQIILIVLILKPLSVFADYPLSDLKEFVSEKERQILKIIDAEIAEVESIKKRLPKKRKIREKTKVLLRLSELNHEKYRTLFAWENRYHREKVKLGLIRGAVVVDVGLSERFLKKSLELSKEISKNDPRYPDIDTVHFFLALNYGEIGNTKESIKWYNKILNKGKKSKYYGEGLTFLGEYWFKKRDYSKSLTQLKKATKDTQMKSYPKALYYLAWSQFKKKQYNSGLENMEKVVRLGDGDGKYISFRSEAMEAIPEFYSNTKRSAGDAPKYLRDLGAGENLYFLLQVLAERYSRRGRLDEVLKLQNARLSGAPGGTGQLAVLLEDAERYRLAARYKLLVETLSRAADNFGPKSKWWSSDNADSEDAEVLKDKLKLRVRNAGAEIHKLAQHYKDKNEKRRQLKYSEALYKSYIKNWENSEDHSEISYYLADVIYEIRNDFNGKILTAALYSQILNDKSASKKLREDSGVSQMTVLGQALKKSPDKTSKDQVRGKLARAIDDYINYKGNLDNAPSLLLQAADLYPDSNPKKISRLEILIKSHPESKEGRYAAEKILSIHEKNKDWRAAEKVSSFLISRGLRGGSGKFKKKLVEVKERSRFKQAEELEKDKKYTEAADYYKEISETTSSKEIKFKALNNAAINYKKAGHVIHSEKTFMQLMKEFPDSSVAADKWIEIANDNFKKGRFNSAANAYWYFSSNFEKKNKNPSRKSKNRILSALNNAYLIWNSIGSYENATKAVDEMLSRFPGSKEVESAVFEQIERDLARKEFKLADKYCRSYLDVFKNGSRRAEAEFQLGRLSSFIGHHKTADGNFKNSVREFEKLKSRKFKRTQSDFAAQSKILLLKNEIEDFRKIKLRMPPSRLKRDIKRKLAALEKLSQNYISVISMGSSTWGVASYGKIAEAYRIFANDLRNIPVHSRMKEADVKVFRDINEKEAKRVESESSKLVQKGLELGQKLEVLEPTFEKIHIEYLQSLRIKREPIELGGFGGVRAALSDSGAFR